MGSRPPIAGVSRTLRARSLRQSLRKSRPAPESKKCPKQYSPESQKRLRLRRLFRACFGHFLDPRAGRPRETLSETPGPGDSCKGQAGSQGVRIYPLNLVGMGCQGIFSARHPPHSVCNTSKSFQSRPFPPPPPGRPGR